MMRNRTAFSNMNINKRVEVKNDFKEKLHVFRQNNAINKLTMTSEKVKKEKAPTPEDRSKISCSSQLFSDWNSMLTADQALAKLNSNLSNIDSYSLDSDLTPEEVLDHLAAQYVVYKHHIDTVGDEKQAKALDKLIEQYTNKYAKEFSETVGVFYEANGMTGERGRLYVSLVDIVKNKITMYETHIAKKPDQLTLLMEDAHNNKKSLSNELRRTVREDKVVFEFGLIKNYTSREMGRAAQLVKISLEMEKNFAKPKIANEEELGLLLGKNMVQALTHVYFGRSISTHGQSFLQSYQNHANRYLDGVDDLLKIEADRYKEMDSDSKKDPFKPMDRDAVFAVVQTMASEYMVDLSVSDAVEKGKAFGLQQYLLKADFESETERYRSSSFWNQAIKDALNPKNKGTVEYHKVQDMLKSKIESWLNAIA